MASIVEPPWRPVSGPSSPKNVHCLSGAVENVDNKRQNIGNPLSPPRSSSPTGPHATDADSDSSEGSIPNTSPRTTSSSTTGSNVGLNTTRSRTGSFTTPRPTTVLPTRGDTAPPTAQTQQHQGIQLKPQCEWNGTHGSPHGVLCKPSSPQYVDKSKDHGPTDAERTRIRLPSLNIPSHRSISDSQVMGHNSHLESIPSFGPASNSLPDGVRRASSSSESTGWSSSPPTSMPPPPLPLQHCAPQVDSLPRIAERAPGMPRTNPLSVSELIHREGNSTQHQHPPTTRTHTSAVVGDRVPSLASEYMDILKLRERVSDANIPKFLEELNHQLSLTGLLREARELICHTFELADLQRNIFAQQTLHMLQMDEPARDVREVVARAVVGMSERDMAGFEYEVIHMLNGSLHRPASPYREALCCAAYAARFPEEQQAELRRQLKRTPLAAFRAHQQQQQQQGQGQQGQQQQGHAASRGGGGQQPRVHNLPPLREWEKLADRRSAPAAGPRPRKDPVRPANYSLREFPIFPSH